MSPWDRVPTLADADEYVRRYEERKRLEAERWEAEQAAKAARLKAWYDSAHKLGKPRIIAGHLHNPGLIEQFLAKPIEKNEGRELRDRLLRALKAVGPEDTYGDEAPVMLQLADINRLIANLESGGDLNEAFGSTQPAHRETGSGNQGEVAAVIVRKLLEGKSVKQVGKELNRQPGDVRRIFQRYPDVVKKTLAKRLAMQPVCRTAPLDPPSPLTLRRENALLQVAKLRDQYFARSRIIKLLVGARSRIIKLLADRGRASH